MFAACAATWPLRSRRRRARHPLRAADDSRVTAAVDGGTPVPARPRPARRSSSKPSPSPGFSDGGPNRTTSGRGRPQVRRSAGALPLVCAQAPRAENHEDRLESRNPVLSGGQASRATDAILTSGPLGLCRADDSKATRLMQSAIAGFACPSIIPERERPLKYRHLPTRSPGWSGLDPAVPDSHGTGQSAAGKGSIISVCGGRNIRRSGRSRSEVGECSVMTSRL